MPPILDVRELTVRFEPQVVIDRLSFSLERGESLAVIGPNGSGKTVLLKALLGMLPHEGEVTWAEGVRLGYVPQKIEVDKHLPMCLSDLFRAKAEVRGGITRAELDRTVEVVGLPRAALQTPIGHLSGGQFQKALIVFALLGKPNVLLFDEPTASIDASGEEQIYEIIHRVQDKYGVTAIVVSHDMTFVYRYASKVLCLNRRGLCYGAPQEVLTTELLEKLYAMPHKYYHHLHPEETSHSHEHDRQ